MALIRQNKKGSSEQILKKYIFYKYVGYHSGGLVALSVGNWVEKHRFIVLSWLKPRQNMEGVLVIEESVLVKEESARYLKSTADVPLCKVPNWQ